MFRLSNVFCIVVVLTCLLLSCKGITLFWEVLLKTLLADGYRPDQLSTAEAIVIARNSNERIDVVTYRFVAYIRDRGVETYTNEDCLFDGHKSLKVGDTVQVEYVTDQPWISAIAGVYSKFQHACLESRFSDSLMFYCGSSGLLLLPTLLIIAWWIDSAVRGWGKRIKKVMN